jgi:hypothetical protein
LTATRPFNYPKGGASAAAVVRFPPNTSSTRTLAMLTADRWFCKRRLAWFLCGLALVSFAQLRPAATGQEAKKQLSELDPDHVAKMAKGMELF